MVGMVDAEKDANQDNLNLSNTIIAIKNTENIKFAME